MVSTLAKIATSMLDPHLPYLSAEDLYRTVLQAIARGHFAGGRDPVAGIGRCAAGSG